jgi:5-methyltetrahydropteroyltriglutamate--homocysteine methyltransferase
MEPMTTPYRADQVGSFLRPPGLLEARAAHADGRLALEELRAREDQAIRDVLAEQRRVGIDVYSDGELRRGSWLTSMAESVDGFVPTRVPIEWHGPGGGVEGSTAQVAGARLRKLRRLARHELPFLKANAPGPFKITLPAPSNFMVTSYRAGITDRVYPRRGDMLRDLVEIVRDELQWLVSEGVPYIQLDAPYYSAYLDPQMRERVRQAGVEPDRALDQAIAADNDAAAAGRQPGVVLGLHICRGNNRSRWLAEGGYESIAEKLFGTLGVDRFLLEYDGERAGGFEPLRLVPRGKTVVLGLITTKEPRLESPDELRRRIDAAARYVPLEDLALSPQCGFASVAAGNLLSIDDQWRKLELVDETARKVWG